jgi:hydroxymethylbilane synthase
MSQSRQVAEHLAAATGREFRLVTVRTRGDVDRGPLAQIGGTGVFVTAVREALAADEVDIAVHSYKDLPTAADPAVHLGAVPAREDPADVLCAADGRTLAELPPNSLVGTGSPRRAAQLLRLRPDVRPVPVRGNVDTRLAAVAAGDLAAVVLARAGLARLGRLDAVTQTFAAVDMVPAPAQGALAVECRAGDEAMAAALATIDDAASRAATQAERALLAGLQAGCAAPVGALAAIVAGTLVLTARVIAADGRDVREHRARGPVQRAEELGSRTAEALLADGAGALMGRPA